MAFKTAMGMSFISMLAMEMAENIVDYHLTGGVVALQDPRFWTAAIAKEMGEGMSLESLRERLILVHV
ncbi:hypothetical protein D6C76_01292 [Aureobasidium pullulans]|nr:hypothetical protein D6C76_01292 [Aureobasidium pullulans]